MMTDPIFWVAAAAAIAVLVILVTGILTFARGGDFNRKHGNRLMRYRIYAQGVAVVLIVLFAYLRMQGGQ